jgi:hypothetical protein
VTRVPRQSADAIRDEMRVGRAVISRLPTPDAPTLVRLADDVEALQAVGTVLGNIGRRRPTPLRTVRPPSAHRMSLGVAA